MNPASAGAEPYQPEHRVYYNAELADDDWND